MAVTALGVVLSACSSASAPDSELSSTAVETGVAMPTSPSREQLDGSSVPKPPVSTTPDEGEERVANLRALAVGDNIDYRSCTKLVDSFNRDDVWVPGQCHSLPAVEFAHPQYGQAWFIMGMAKGDDLDNTLIYWILDEHGATQTQRQRALDDNFYVSAPVLDGSGNIIYTFNPGRSNGCVALHPQANWFEGFGTDLLEVSDSETSYATRFYGCHWMDDDLDGTKEIFFQPSGGADYIAPQQIYTWNGSEYVCEWCDS